MSLQIIAQKLVVQQSGENMAPEVTHKVAKATNEPEFLAPPHSIEAEQSVLGGLLLDNAAWDRLGGILKEVDFYRFEHRLIFHHIVRLIAASKPADVITVFESLQASGQADESGGVEYLNALVTEYTVSSQYPALCADYP